MKPSLTKFDFGAIGVAVLLTAAGAGAYFWASGQLDDAKAQVDAGRQKLTALQGRRFLPSQANVKTLKANNEAAQTLVGTVAEQLKTSEAPLAAVGEMNPVEFKNKLDITVKKLRTAADLKKTVLPPNFHFSFGRYVQANPSQAATLILGKQLLAIEQISGMLFDSGITKLNAVRRSFDEDSGALLSPSGATGESEVLKARVSKGTEGLYVVYPFEVEFEGSPRALRDFLEHLAQSPFLYVTRSVQVSNLDPQPKRREDLKKNDVAPVDPASGAPVVSQPPRTVQGLELIRSKIRLDLVEWLGSGTPAKKSKK
jgi:hypothetical protein